MPQEIKNPQLKKTLSVLNDTSIKVLWPISVITIIGICFDEKEIEEFRKEAKGVIFELLDKGDKKIKTWLFTTLSDPEVQKDFPDDEILRKLEEFKNNRANKKVVKIAKKLLRLAEKIRAEHSLRSFILRGFCLTKSGLLDKFII